MNVFENLIEELQDENLIEQSVIKTHQAKTEKVEKPKNGEAENIAENDARDHFKGFQAPENESPVGMDKDNLGNVPGASEQENDNVILPFDENDFYRRRAMEEVSSLQMVERVLSGVEREQLKVIPKSYDDIQVSKALHDFLQASKNANSPENAAAEFKLMQETESWYSALSHRDQNILPAHLRRYCETTKPVLSSHALAGVARFYRNSPFNEAVRSKFELVATRLFSKEIGGDLRDMAFGVNELAQHLSELYADWSSISLYSTDDDSELTILALKFEDFIAEAEAATEFEELVKSDFFNRLRAFKESCGEKFFAPQLTATAVRCNVRVGNRYVDLINQERERNKAGALEDKYSFLLDQTVSDATSKTLQLVELLNQENDFSREENQSSESNLVTVKVQVPDKPAAAKDNRNKGKTGFRKKIFSVNKWLLGLTILTVMASFGLYSWVELLAPQVSSQEVITIDFDGYYFKEYLKVSKVNNETLIGIAAPAWNSLSDDKKQEALKNMLVVGKEKGFRNVRILSNEGKTVNYISESNITQVNQMQ